VEKRAADGSRDGSKTEKFVKRLVQNAYVICQKREGETELRKETDKSSGARKMKRKTGERNLRASKRHGAWRELGSCQRQGGG